MPLVALEIGNGAKHVDDLGIGVGVPALVFSLAAFMGFTKSNGDHPWHLGLAYCGGKLLIHL